MYNGVRKRGLPWLVVFKTGLTIARFYIPVYNRMLVDTFDALCNLSHYNKCVSQLVKKRGIPTQE